MSDQKRETDEKVKGKKNEDKSSKGLEETKKQVEETFEKGTIDRKND